MQLAHPKVAQPEPVAFQPQVCQWINFSIQLYQVLYTFYMINGFMPTSTYSVAFDRLLLLQIVP